jgi:glutamate synthase (NADPH/NADH) large chain
MCWAATERCWQDNNILILSDRAVSGPHSDAGAAGAAAVHHHLIRRACACRSGLVVETGEAREVHHFCVLAGYGAEAINPYLAFETLEQIRVPKAPGIADDEDVRRTTSRRSARAC